MCRLSRWRRGIALKNIRPIFMEHPRGDLRIAPICYYRVAGHGPRAGRLNENNWRNDGRHYR